MNLPRPSLSEKTETTETYSEEETVARREAALKRMLKTPHKPHKESKKPRR
jgi:hypothetical protein